MADRIFNYEGVADVYKKMQAITDEINTTLVNIDKEYHNKVDVSEEAIYGDLGKQLLLDWENTSSNFDSFIDNFDHWATLIAQSSGNYAEFEEAIAGFKDANPLGATSDGITDAYTNTGYYAQYMDKHSDEYVLLSSSAKNINGIDPTTASYDYSDSAALLSRHQVIGKIMLAGDIFSSVLIAFSLIGAAGSSVPAVVEETPLLTGGETSLLLEGTGQSVWLTDLADTVALTNPGSAATNQMLGFISQAESLGASYASIADGSGLVKFFNDAGTLIATLDQSGAFAIAL